MYLRIHRLQMWIIHQYALIHAHHLFMARLNGYTVLYNFKTCTDKDILGKNSKRQRNPKSPRSLPEKSTTPARTEPPASLRKPLSNNKHDEPRDKQRKRQMSSSWRGGALLHFICCRVDRSFARWLFRCCQICTHNILGWILCSFYIHGSESDRSAI